MNLQQLYYFRKLAEVQHYTEAAKALYITQPSLSDSIASLEHEFSVSLFQKKGRGIQLTKYGQEFYQYVNQALGILEHGIAIIKEKSDSVTGTIDVGFCSMVENRDDLVFVPITYQELIMIVRNAPLASFDSIELTALKKYTLFTYRDTIPIGKTIRKILNRKDMEASYCYDDEISIAGQINRSSKAAIVADTPFLKQFDNLKKIHLTDVPKDTRLLYMVYSKKNFITAAVEAFANFMVARCLNLPPESPASIA